MNNDDYLSCAAVIVILLPIIVWFLRLVWREVPPHGAIEGNVDHTELGE